MTCKPVFKNIHPVFEVKKGVLRLGEIHGTAVEVDDEDGSIRALIKLLNGERTVDEIYKSLLVHYPDMPKEDIEEALQELNRLGFLYDNTTSEESSLSKIQRERYKANLNYFSAFSDLSLNQHEYQERLLQSRVTIIGVGAYGSSILANLTGLGVGKIRIVDFDRIELSNLNRQFLYSEADIGELKIIKAKEFVTGVNSDIEVEAINMQVSSTDDIEQIIKGSDLVVLAADQPLFILQRWVNDVCIKNNIPFMSGGINLTLGSFFTVIPGVSACIDCMHIERTKMTEEYPMILENFLLANNRFPTATITPNLLLVTSMMAADIVFILTNLNPVNSLGNFVTIDFRNFEKTVRSFSRQDECPICGDCKQEGDNLEIINTLKRLEQKLVHQ